MATGNLGKPAIREGENPRYQSRVAQLISVIVPVFNEADSLPRLHAEISEAMTAWGRPFEIVFVNDGSTDGSEDLLDELAEADDLVRVVHFRRNFGQTAALSAGMEFADGDVLVPLDADLQNDPADIPALVEKLEQGYDVVSGWRKARHDKWLTRRSGASNCERIRESPPPPHRGIPAADRARKGRAPFHA
jgi:glycosyltransferase involved in cell wall biosynthesis